jgi:hypothetical protein
VCHRDEGTGGRSALDLRFELSLEETGLCDPTPNAGNLSIQDAGVVVPGAPERSVLLARMKADQSARMPPLGSTLPDPEGVPLIEEWIASLDSCP